jgi:hypothetical protein
MASDWIKWVKGLTRRAEVVRMACRHPSASNVDRRRIAVACMEFWEWADDETSDGQLVGVGAAFIDDLVGLPGFYAGMVSVGWIIETSPNSIMLANFDRHNGSTAKRRAKDVEYKREGRSSASRADTRPHPARTDCGPEKRREEERREDLSKTGIHAASGDPPAAKKKPIGITAEEFMAVWRANGHHGAELLAAAADFHAHRVAMRKPITQLAAGKLVSMCSGFSPAEIIADIIRAIASGYQGLRPTRIVTTETKKNNRDAEIEAQMARVRAKMGITA